MAFNIKNLLTNNNKSNNTSLIFVFVIITVFTIFTSWYLLSGDDEITVKNNTNNEENDDDDTTPESDSKQDNTDSTNTCDASIAPMYGSVGDCTSTLASGSTCQPICDNGYTVWSPDGSNMTSCNLGNLTAASCLANSCNASIPPTNGGVGDCTSTLASGSTCQPTCNDGYTVSGNTTCQLGILTEATCEPSSCNAQITQPVSDFENNGWHSSYGDCPDDLASGSSCTQSCPDGYTISGKSECLLGTITHGQCEPSSCNDMASTDPKMWDDSQGQYVTLGSAVNGDCTTTLASGSTCQPMCNDGYTVSGNTECRLGEIIAEATCEPNSCDLPTAPTNGELGTCDAFINTMYSGNWCNFECDDGYTRKGVQTACYLGELTEQTCEPSPCSMENPMNGGAGDCPTELAHNGTCTPTCDNGYTLSSTKSTTSCSLGVLTKAECLPNSCTMQDPENGLAGTNCTSPFTHGSECTPTCDTGYTVSGKTSCSAGTLTLAECIPSTCDASSTTVNSITNSGCPSDLASGSICQPTCNDGYTLAGYTDCYFGNKIKVATCFLYQYEFIMNIKSSALGPHIEYIKINDTLLTKDQTFIHIIPTHNNNSDNMFIDDDSLSKWGSSGYSTNDKIFTIGSDTQIKQIKIVYSEPQYVPGWIIKENGITVITDTGNGGDLQIPKHVTYTYDIENGTSTAGTPQLASFVKYEKKKFKSDVTEIWIDAGNGTNANPGIDRSDKENTVSEQHVSTMMDSGNNISACKTKCLNMDKCKSILYYPKQLKCYFSGVEVNSDNIEDNPSENRIVKTHLYEIIRPKGDSCDTSIPPTNGSVGDCVSELEDGESCQPICNTGYVVSGNSSCDDGVLTAATCSAKNSYEKVTGVVIGTQNAFAEYNLNIDVLDDGSPTPIMWGTIDECKAKCDTFDDCKGFQYRLGSSWVNGKWRYGCKFKSMDIQKPGSSEECDMFATENCSEHASVSNWQSSYRKVPNFVTSTDDNDR